MKILEMFRDPVCKYCGKRHSHDFSDVKWWNCYILQRGKLQDYENAHREPKRLIQKP